MGAVGGTVWHGIKGARNSPRGDRLLGSLSAIKARAPVVGGNFGVWGGLFSSFDCAVKGYRQKEDPYNAIISGFLTGGTLAVRSASPSPSSPSSFAPSSSKLTQFTLDRWAEGHARLGHRLRYPPRCLRGCRRARRSVRPLQLSSILPLPTPADVSLYAATGCSPRPTSPSRLSCVSLLFPCPSLLVVRN